MPADTVDDVYSSLRALLPSSPPAITTPKNRAGKFGPQAPSRRQYKKPIEHTTTRPIAETLGASPAKLKAAKVAGPCEGCRHADRCRERLACRALELFVNSGRASEFAPRQPSRAIYQRLYPEAAAV
jgi:hypothetical protein